MASHLIWIVDNSDHDLCCCSHQESYLKPVHKIATISLATVGRQYERNREKRILECKHRVEYKR